MRLATTSLCLPVGVWPECVSTGVHADQNAQGQHKVWPCSANKLHRDNAGCGLAHQTCRTSLVLSGPSLGRFGGVDTKEHVGRVSSAACTREVL